MIRIEEVEYNLNWEEERWSASEVCVCQRYS